MLMSAVINDFAFSCAHALSQHIQFQLTPVADLTPFSDAPRPINKSHLVFEIFFLHPPPSPIFFLFLFFFLFEFLLPYNFYWRRMLRHFRRFMQIFFIYFYFCRLIFFYLYFLVL